MAVQWKNNPNMGTNSQVKSTKLHVDIEKAFLDHTHPDLGGGSGGNGTYYNITLDYDNAFAPLTKNDSGHLLPEAGYTCLQSGVIYLKSSINESSDIIEIRVNGQPAANIGGAASPDSTTIIVSDGDIVTAVNTGENSSIAADIYFESFNFVPFKHQNTPNFLFNLDYSKAQSILEMENGFVAPESGMIFFNYGNDSDHPLSLQINNLQVGFVSENTSGAYICSFPINKGDIFTLTNLADNTFPSYIVFNDIKTSRISNWAEYNCWLYFVPNVAQVEVKDSKGEFVVDAPVGSFQWWMGLPSEIPQDWLVCDGSEFSATDYPELFKALGTNVLPNLIGRFVKGNTVSGNYEEAGLPNITGEFACEANSSGNTGEKYTKGAFSVANYSVKRHLAGDSDPTNYPFIFDASRSNPIYGNSSTVTPENISAIPLIKAKKSLHNWVIGMPDWNTVTEYTIENDDADGWTAPSDGWVVLPTDKSNTGAISVYVNGQLIGSGSRNSSGNDSWVTLETIRVPVKSGDKITQSGNVNTTLRFYPIIGEEEKDELIESLRDRIEVLESRNNFLSSAPDLSRAVELTSISELFGKTDTCWSNHVYKINVPGYFYFACRDSHHDIDLNVILSSNTTALDMLPTNINTYSNYCMSWESRSDDDDYCEHNFFFQLLVPGTSTYMRLQIGSNTDKDKGPRFWFIPCKGVPKNIPSSQFCPEAMQVTNVNLTTGGDNDKALSHTDLIANSNLLDPNIQAIFAGDWEDNFSNI